MEKPGRKRSEEARTAVLRATRELVVEEGFAHLTIEKIAARARVGKPTIYRWWQSKNAILAECVLGGEVLPLTADTSVAGMQSSPIDWFRAVIAYVDDNAPLIRGLAAAAYEDPAISAKLRAHLTEPIVEALRAATQTTRPSEPQPGDLSANALAQLLFGTILYRLAQPWEAPDDAIDEIIEALFVRYRP